jgi:hypothetical protein
VGRRTRTRIKDSNESVLPTKKEVKTGMY